MNAVDRDPPGRTGAVRPDGTVHLDVTDLMPGDDFDARLVEIEGARYGGASVRGGRVVPRRPPPAPPPVPSGAAAVTASSPFALPLLPDAPLGGGPVDDRTLLRSFRNDPLSRLLGALRRLLGR